MLTLQVSAEEVKNFVINNDFEEGAGNWSLWVEDANAGAVMEADKKEQLKGKQSLLIDIFKAGGGKRVELHQRHFNLKKGQKLTYALWTKADSVRPAIMIANHRAAPWTVYGSKNFLIEQDWKEFWTPVLMPVDDNIVGIYLELRDSTKGKVWVDNVRFYEGDYVPEKNLRAKQPEAVEPKSKLAIAWGKIKK
jgi:hypothetical protein